jgi:hypothetical protein
MRQVKLHSPRPLIKFMQVAGIVSPSVVSEAKPAVAGTGMTKLSGDLVKILPVDPAAYQYLKDHL